MDALDWATQWEVADLSADQMPAEPIPPPQPYVDADEEAGAAYVESLALYEDAKRSYQHALDTALQAAQWITVRHPANDEAEARRTLAELRAVNAGNRLARNFVLVSAPARVWTVTE
ncbi:hypothetical protein [Mycolicibacterium sp.]|uniref:hypothetical protein n=1 Tax=Mycolicibacterium sp. TaxID=2320850 RepID=UPI00355D9848